MKLVRLAHHRRMDFVERQHLMHQYRDGYRAVTAALANVTEAELDKRPAAGAWTARDHVVPPPAQAHR